MEKIDIAQKIVWENLLYTITFLVKSSSGFQGTETVARRCSVEKVILEISQNSQENSSASLFLKKETLAQVFSCEFCEIF